METIKLESNYENERNSEISELKDKLKFLYKRNPIETNEKICDFVSQLRNSGLDCENYLLYHLLIGSTPSEETPPQKYDFEGEYSIKRFIENLYQQEAAEKLIDNPV